MNIRIIAAYAVLLILGVPWYWPPEQTTFYMGLPLWALVSLSAGFFASLLTAWLFLRTSPPDNGN